ncbi:ROK family protein [Solitalea lacus]|uniref:ROK family protein n=1 Tax=Solitalea lacus TaxID=2911172 RepID=UPI001EDA5AB7|nr:ROK family protein [Solitalea lacus]UKJ05876.1 ROK family protein [Solitalea lacus]
MKAKIKNSKDVGLKNKILKQLFFNKSLSCLDLSELINKSIPFVTKAIHEMIEDDMVIEQGYAPSSGGRRPLMYTLKPDKMYVVSVAMDQLITRITIIDSSTNYITPVSSLELPLYNNTSALSQLIEFISLHIENSGIRKEQIVGVGIGMPGFINTEEGANYTFLNAGDQSLQKHLSTALSLPVYIDNDSSLIALAEFKFGLAKSKDTALVINVGWGIGLGLILNGQLFRGHSGFAGEFSHIPTSDNDNLCSCGKRGCLETEASMLLVANKALEEYKQGTVSSLGDISNLSPREVVSAIMEAANKGDQYAVELILDAGYALGRGVSILIHIINPEVIILSGRGAVVGKILLASIQQALHKYTIPRLAESTELCVSNLGFEAEIIGAASLVIENLDKTPAKLKSATVPKGALIS